MTQLTSKNTKMFQKFEIGESLYYSHMNLYKIRIYNIHMYSYPQSDHVFRTPVMVITLNRRDFPRRSRRRVHIRSKSTKRRHPFARSCMKNMVMIMSTFADHCEANLFFFFSFFGWCSPPFFSCGTLVGSPWPLEDSHDPD